MSEPNNADSLASALAECSRPMFSIADLRTFLERSTGSKPSRTTIWRWVRHGIRATDGSLVLLRITQIGGRIFVARQDLLDFVVATTTSPRASDQTTEEREQ